MKKKKIGIVSLYGNNNYGNKLQAYALQEYCKKLGYEVGVIKNGTPRSANNKIMKVLKRIVQLIRILFPIKEYKNDNFKEFEKNLNTTRRCYYSYDKNIFLKKSYDYFIVGSDQVWNPYFGLKNNFTFLEFAKDKPNIAFSASFGVDSIPDDMKERYVNGLKELDYISVREDIGKKMVENFTNRNDVEVLVDPTMLLTQKEWCNVAKRPNNLKDDKYILSYFLGEQSIDRRNQIKEMASKNGWKVINILDKNDAFADCGPAEFVYLEQHAELICTDSFHACVFGILMNTPFIIFNREDKEEPMNSRIDTLLSKFKLEDRRCSGKVNERYLKCDYSNSYKILENERKKANLFLKRALEIEGKNENKK